MDLWRITTRAFLAFPLICLIAADTGNAYQDKINEFATNSFESNTVQFPLESYKTLESLIAHEGKPDKIQKIPDRQLFRDADYWLGIEYHNEYLQYYYSSLKESFFVRLRRFTGNDFRFKYGVRIGMAEEELVQIFGQNYSRQRSEDGYDIWYYPDTGNVQLGFHFTNQRGLEWITIISGGVKGQQ